MFYCMSCDYSARYIFRLSYNHQTQASNNSNSEIFLREFRPWNPENKSEAEDGCLINAICMFGYIYNSLYLEDYKGSHMTPKNNLLSV